MPILAVKACCYSRNGEYLQKILEQYNNFDPNTLKEGLTESMINKLELGDILNYKVLEGKE